MLPDGSLYEGYFSEDMFHFYGRLIGGVDGNVYEGEWQKGQACGIATLWQADGSLYRGRWKDDL